MANIFKNRPFKLIFSDLINPNSVDIKKVPSTYQKKIFSYYMDNKDAIEKKIKKYLSKNWTWDRIHYIDKAIMIEAFSEWQVFQNEKQKIIDNAVKSMKRYSDENSYKYVNGILNSIIK